MITSRIAALYGVVQWMNGVAAPARVRQRAPWSRYRLYSGRNLRDTFMCSSCGAETLKWAGRCSECGAWASIVRFSVPRGGNGAASGPTGVATRGNWATRVTGEPLALTPVTDVGPAPRGARRQLPSSELNSVLGGGLTVGSVVLLAGTPGVGKSTLALQLAAMLATPEQAPPPRVAPSSPSTASDAEAEGTSIDGALGRVAYVSGEESAYQLRDRAVRLSATASGLFVLNETNIDAVMTQLDRARAAGEGFDALVVDSIQAVHVDDVPASAGSPSQVRECALRLLQYAKATATTVILVGHVTKGGDIAGPRTLEHLVDTVLYLEGETTTPYRLLRAVKNRFGSTSEVAVFEMTDTGVVDAPNPARLFLTHPPPPKDGSESTAASHVSGAAIAAVMEGTRAMCVEVQALCTVTPLEYPRHRATGVSTDRLFLLLAVLSKHVRLRPMRRDVLVSVVGGLRVSDPGADLALATAIASSLLECNVPTDVALVGEVGLGGELRPVGDMRARAAAAAALGFRKLVAPAPVPHARLPVYVTKTLQQALSHVLRRLPGARSSTRGNRRSATNAAKLLDEIADNTLEDELDERESSNDTEANVNDEWPYDDTKGVDDSGNGQHEER